MNIHMWGTGRLAANVLRDVISIDLINRFIDNDNTKELFLDKPVYVPEKIKSLDYDAILVANSFTDQIVEQAIDRYESDNNISLCKFPLCDKSGTLVITK